MLSVTRALPVALLSSVTVSRILTVPGWDSLTVGNGDVAFVRVAAPDSISQKYFSSSPSTSEDPLPSRKYSMPGWTVWSDPASATGAVFPVSNTTVSRLTSIPSSTASQNSYLPFLSTRKDATGELASMIGLSLVGGTSL